MTDPTHRRDFVRILALGGTAAALAIPSAEAVAQDQAAKPKGEVDARMDLILARYGKHLDDDAKKAVRAEVESIVKRGEQLRKFSLSNGDEPFPVFHPYRAPLA